MRVLLVVSSTRLAGTERHVVALAEGLRSAGIDAEVACIPGGEGLDATLRSRGVPVHPLPLAGRGMVGATLRLAQLARRVDVVHTHLTMATVAGVGAGLVTGRPVVETRHFLVMAYQTRARSGRTLGMLLRAVLARRVSLTLAPSKAVLDRVAGRSVLVPHGVEPRPTAERSAGEARFVTVGRMDGDRDYELLLQAFAAVVADGLSEARLTIVGDGRERDGLERLSKSLGVAERVDFVGWADDATPFLDASEVYLAAPLLPVPEAFGLAILEAMRSGLPVIAEPGGGASDLVEDGVTGRLVPTDARAWAAAMLAFARDPGAAAAMGDAGRRRAESHFSSNAMVAKTIEAYRTVVDDEGQRRVLRVYHSAMVTDWRERDRQLRRRGFNVTTVAPLQGDEGGRMVRLDPGADTFVVAARTFGRHPMLFAYDPRPIWRLLRAHRFDAIDIHEEPASVSAAELLFLALVLSPQSKVVFYSAQNIYKRYPPPFRWFERWALRRADGVYACNREAGEIMRRKGCRGAIRVVPLGVDVDRFSPDGHERQPPDVGDTVLRIGYVGRLNRQKGVHVLLDAVARAPDWSLDLIGDGPERAALEAQAAALGLGGRARFRGNLDYGSLPALYPTFDVLVVPSVPMSSVLEQFCRVAVEAMACGVPVVASDIGSLPDVLGDRGVLVPPGDAGALHDALVGLERDPARRRAMGEAARVWAQRYDWSSVAEAHAALYVEAGV